MRIKIYGREIIDRRNSKFFNTVLQFFQDYTKEKRYFREQSNFE